MTYVYEPSRRLSARINRRLTIYRNRKIIPVNCDKPIVSFTFDDCPLSGLQNGVRRLEKEGWLSTIYIACGLLDTENHLGKMMGGNDTKAAYASGHEIGEHTYSHRDANSMDLGEYLIDIDRNQAALSDLGIPPSATMAYPYGETHSALKKALSMRFAGSRGILPTIHHKEVDLNQIGSVPVFTNQMQSALQAIGQLKEQGGWLTLFTHDVRETPSLWGCTPSDLDDIIRAVHDSGAQVLTVKDAISSLGDYHGR